MLVSNFGNAQATTNLSVGRSSWAKCFSTGTNIGGYNLTSLELDVKVVPPSTTTLRVAIYSSTVASGNVVPNSQVVALDIPTLAVGTSTFTAPANTVLAASTVAATASYCVVVRDSAFGGTTLELGTATTGSADSTGLTGWALGMGYQQAPFSSWSLNDISNNMRVRLNGSAVVGGTVSTDATLKELSLGTGVTLSPPFASGATTYTASVANSVDEVTVTPTTNHADATVEYQDASDTALADADITRPATRWRWRWATPSSR